MTRAILLAVSVTTGVCLGCSHTAQDAPTITAQDQFTALIQKAGYEPHPANKGSGNVPYFEAMTSTEGTRLGLPDGLKVIYALPDDRKNLIFWGEIRPLRSDEITAPADVPENAELAPELVAKLQKANPDVKHATFLTSKIESKTPDGQVVDQPMLLLDVEFVNKEVTADAVGTIKDEMVKVLSATDRLWW